MASIKQNPAPIPTTLPDLRNLGVQLRVLIGASLLALVAAVLSTPTLADSWQALLEICAGLQPVLLATMLVLFLAHRPLAALPYPLGVALVYALVLALTTLLYLGAQWLAGPGVSAPLPRLWFYAGLFTTLMLLYFHLRERALSPAITEARLQALQARIRPHFLFNSLNTVLSLIRSDPARAEAALQDLAELFRALVADHRRLVPLTEEIALCRQYLALEQLRLGERLRASWQVDGLPPDALAPPLLLQPLLENAVYHGIEPLADGGEIRVAIARRRHEIHVYIDNPWRPPTPAQPGRGGNHIALHNIRERLALHFDAEARLEIHAGTSHYRVHIVLPYQAGA